MYEKVELGEDGGGGDINQKKIEVTLAADCIQKMPAVNDGSKQTKGWWKRKKEVGKY